MAHISWLEELTKGLQACRNTRCEFMQQPGHGLLAAGTLPAKQVCIQGLVNQPLLDDFLQTIRRESPRIGGNFANWGLMFSVFDCTCLYIRKKVSTTCQDAGMGLLSQCIAQHAII